MAGDKYAMLYGSYGGVPSKKLKIQEQQEKVEEVGESTRQIQDSIDDLKNVVAAQGERIEQIYTILLRQESRQSQAVQTISGIDFVNGMPLIEDSEEELEKAHIFFKKYSGLVRIQLHKASVEADRNQPKRAATELQMAVDADQKLQEVVKVLKSRGEMEKVELPNLMDVLNKDFSDEVMKELERLCA